MAYLQAFWVLLLALNSRDTQAQFRKRATWLLRAPTSKQDKTGRRALALLGVGNELGAPIISHAKEQGLSYNASQMNFTLNSVPQSMMIPNGDVNGTLKIVATITNDGKVLEGSLELDLGLYGSGNINTGSLIEGELEAFGFKDEDGPSTEYDFLFKITGGNLVSDHRVAEMLFMKKLAVTVESTASTFPGSFQDDFVGNVKGFIGTIEAGSESGDDPVEDGVDGIVDVIIDGELVGVPASEANEYITNEPSSTPLVAGASEPTLIETSEPTLVPSASRSSLPTLPPFVIETLEVLEPSIAPTVHIIQEHNTPHQDEDPEADVLPGSFQDSSTLAPTGSQADKMPPEDNDMPEILQQRKKVIGKGARLTRAPILSKGKGKVEDYYDFHDYHHYYEQFPSKKAKKGGKKGGKKGKGVYRKKSIGSGKKTLAKGGKAGKGLERGKGGKGGKGSGKKS